LRTRAGAHATGGAPLSKAKRRALAAVSLLATALFLGLGVWQVERRASKLALIEAVAERVDAPPVLAPPPAQWPSVRPEHDAYRHVTIRGRYLDDRETLVQALTEDGAGFWVMTPLRSDGGAVVLVNRGFVPSERKEQSTRRSGLVKGEASVVGLLRMSEPKGGFLRSNQPAQDRWFSRDVDAIVRACGLGHAAPYFIDADAAPNAGGWPRGGMTVVAFPNNHLVYSITWFGLAMLSLTGLFLVLRTRR
jgi:surfeit locus 1 family protein